ncbi:MAG: polysaccharide biosynthesis tyrosine autokinase [Dysgonomonas sp.]|nr:polysaccharide biosynthesis tyrosine autokinase [Dysgonomonas sp.]
MNKIEKEWEDNETTSLAEVFYEYLRYWKWFILSVVLCLVVGVAIILTTQRQYKSTLSVILNEEKSASNKGSAEINLDVIGLLSTTNNIDNEIAIFSSPDLLSSVIDSLNLQTTYYIENVFRKIESYQEFPFYVAYKSKKEELAGNIKFNIVKSGAEYEVKGVYTQLGGNKVEINQSIERFPAQIYLPDSIGYVDILSRSVKVKDNEKYFVVINDKSSTLRVLSSSLSVTPTSKNSSVLGLTLLVNNAEKGAVVLRELVKQYNEMNVKVNNEMAYNTALFINERLKEIAIELGDVEREVVDYKQRNRIADLGSEAQLFVQQTGQNQQKLMEVETQLNVISLVDRFVNDPNNQLKLIPNLGVSDPTLSQVITEYNSKILDSDALLKSTGEENPMRIRLTEEINNMRNSISSSLTNVKQAYSISKRDLQRLSGTTQARIQSIPQQEKGLIEKVRQQQLKESLFLFLMQKREETNLSIASTSDKARIIASPQTRLIPVAPKSQTILLVSFILGVLIPVVIIYIVNLLRTHIRGRSELEKLAKVSIIGQIGKNDTKANIVIGEGQNSGVAEMFRALRNNLNFALNNKEKNVILITSSLSGEGKTFVSVNLSVTYALSGKRVLLIGADIRRPRLKEYVQINVNKGLSDFLIDRDSDWNKYINNSGLHPNMDVMMAGTIPPNPNELLMNQKLDGFFKEIEEVYDIVILDTAPVGLVSDSYQIGKYADVTLYIVRENVTPRDAINFVNTQRRDNRLKNMYLVLNGSTLDSSYKYGYGKGYGYENI